MAHFVRSGIPSSLAPQAYFDSPYNPVSYRDTATSWSRSLALGIPTPPTFPIGALLIKTIQFNPNPGASIHDSMDNLRHPWMPNIIQGQIQTYLGAPYSTQPAFTDPTAQRAHAFLPNTIQCRVIGLLGCPFNPGAYSDLAPRPHAFLPNTIQCNVQSLLGIPFNPGAYSDLTAPRAHAFLPNIIQCPVSSLLGIPYNYGSYIDLTAVRAHAFLPSTIQCKVTAYLGAPFDSQPLKGTSHNYLLGLYPPGYSGAMPNRNFWQVPYDSKPYFDTYARLNLVPLNATVQAPFYNVWNIGFNPVSYQDNGASPLNPNLFAPGYSGALPNRKQWEVPYDPKQYLDTSTRNAFLPQSIQCNVQSLLGIPFNTVSYNDLTAPRAHAFLPQSIQCNVQGLLGVPFNPGSYSDLTAPRAHAFLPNTIQCQVAAYLGAPFSTGAYVDKRHERENAFLPNIIQCPVVSYQGGPFDTKAYIDRWQWSAAAFLPKTIQCQVAVYLGGPFDTKGYIDRWPWDANAFLPSTIQCQVSGYLGSPFDTVSFRDRNIINFNPNLYPAFVQRPLNPPLLGVPYDPQLQRETPFWIGSYSIRFRIIPPIDIKQYPASNILAFPAGQTIAYPAPAMTLSYPTET